MITTNNTYSGASFSYEGENATANGDFRVENGNLVSINASGTCEDNNNGTPNNVSFWANRDAAGNVNINGVPLSKLTEVVAIVETIFNEVEQLNEQ